MRRFAGPVEPATTLPSSCHVWEFLPAANRAKCDVRVPLCPPSRLSPPSAHLDLLFRLRVFDMLTVYRVFVRDFVVVSARGPTAFLAVF
jgi:hypothetical protein